MPCSQSRKEEFIERRIKGREEKEREIEREAEICLPLQTNTGKRVGGACVLEEPLHLRTVWVPLAVCRGLSAAPQTLHLRLKGHRERGNMKNVGARGPRQMP